MAPVRGIVVGGLALLALHPRTVRAQTAPTDSSNDVPVIHRSTLVHVGVATLLTTAVLLPLDATIERGVHVAQRHGGNATTQVANVFNWIGDPGAVIAPVAMIAAGWTTHHHALFDTGINTAEAVILSGGVTTLLKGVAGRTRPAPGPIDADDFAAWSGFGRESHTSFPSGHATVAFAAATALTLSTEQYAPSYTKLVGITTYGIATTVGLARIYTNHHWSSDVALGAGIGTLAGLVVERRAFQQAAAQSPSRLGSLLPSGVTPTPNGDVALTWGWHF